MKTPTHTWECYFSSVCLECCCYARVSFSDLRVPSSKVMQESAEDQAYLNLFGGWIVALHSSHPPMGFKSALSALRLAALSSEQSIQRLDGHKARRQVDGQSPHPGQEV